VDATQFESRYLLVFLRQDDEIGFFFFDIGILDFYGGTLKGRDLTSQFKTLVLQTRPVEVVTVHTESKEDTIRILKHSVVPPVFTFLPREDIPSRIEAREILHKYYGFENWPTNLEQITSESEATLLSLATAARYLESLMLGEQTFPFAKFSPFSGEHPDSFNHGGRMALNGTAMEHLELFEVSGKTKRIQEGSLFFYLD